MGMILTTEKQKELEEVTDKVVKWMNDNLHPHHLITIEHGRVELLEGSCAIKNEKHYLD